MANYDVLGVFLISYVSAFGGGIVRNIMINKTPYIFDTMYPLFVSTLVIIILCFITKFYRIERYVEKLEKNQVFVFAYTGALTGISNNFNFG